MKTILGKFAVGAAVAVFAGCMASCMSESPFSASGEGLVRMNVELEADVVPTRAAADEDMLREKCVVYVSNSKGLLHKWIGVDNIPSEISMRYGAYVAEAWSGDSVTASFDKKFFKGVTRFDVSSSSELTQVKVSCRIANVVASVDDSTINSDYVSDMSVSFSNTRGSLEFNAGNWSDKGYFMMPGGDRDLKYVITGTAKQGEPFTKEGVIHDVEAAHEYRLMFEYDPSQSADGGAFIQVVVSDEEIYVEGEVSILGGPAFAWDDGELTPGDQIIGTPGSFESKALRVAAYGGYKSLKVEPSEESANLFIPPVWPSSGEGFDVAGASASYMDELRSIGIDVTPAVVPDAVANADMYKYTFTFSREWLNRLPESDTAYDLVITAVDVYGKSSVTTVSIANTAKAVARRVPLNVDEKAFADDLLSVRAFSVTLPMTYDGSEADGDVALQYRQLGSSEWITQDVDISRRQNGLSVRLSGLSPATSYEYRTAGGKNSSGEYENVSKTGVFTTEDVFVIPNASMEEWSDFSENTKVLLPGAGGRRTFWDSGNHGSSTMGVTLTKSSSDMVGSGEMSARLRSQFVGMGIIGKFAAGNLFAGTYKETKGTNGVIDFGREYGGSHPSALKVLANYRPGTELKGNGKVDGETVLHNGQNDHAQIYVAFTTKVVTVDTSDTKTLLKADADYVLGYGEVTWTDSFGPDGTLQEIKIPVVWNEKAKSEKPTHVIIVCSASKYGDYFTGCEGSLMYVDDFEFEYE